MGDVLIGEFTLSQKCKHRIWQVKRKYGLSPNLYTNRKSKHARRKILYVCSFFLLVMFLLTQKWCYATHNDVARKCSQWCDVCPLCRRHNIIHAVNITAEGNITCPQGQTSFSVNAPLRASRYIGLFFCYLSSLICSVEKAESEKSDCSADKKSRDKSYHHSYTPFLWYM